ncbi:YrzI family small protein [Ectobacillus ponti]|uniref:YrzI family small protein n=1 Tax=Ectobacillus ponti TaxID=2961894 RepID=A0AA42BNU8_9BACI|nr:YrzI family small protein [Ectobacillus ponti]MCP8968380.1 YrzI family small protein [Ectobacillus ponti]
MKFHLLSLVVTISRHHMSLAEAEHKQHVQEQMEEMKEQQAFHCHLF